MRQSITPTNWLVVMLLRFTVPRLVITDFCAQQSVEGFPTLKLFKKGEFVEIYQGPRTMKGFLEAFKPTYDLVLAYGNRVLYLLQNWRCFKQ